MVYPLTRTESSTNMKIILSEWERKFLSLANNKEGFLTMHEDEIRFYAHSTKVIDSLLDKGFLIYYEACYWLTHSGKDALGETGKQIVCSPGDILRDQKGQR